MIPFMTCLPIINIKGSDSNPDGFGSAAFFDCAEYFSIFGRYDRKWSRKQRNLYKEKEAILHSFNKTLILDFTHIPYTVISPREERQKTKENS